MFKEKIIYIIIFICTICYLSAKENALNDSSGNIFSTIINDFKDAEKDAVFICNDFINFDKRDLYKGIGIISLTGYSFLLDEDSRRYELNHQSKTNYNFFNVTNHFGIVTDAVIFGGAIYAGGLITGVDDIRITGRQIFESMVLAGIFSLPMKFIFGRARPYNNLGSMTFKPFNFHDNFNSFPSGHTTVAFSVASVLAFKIDTWWSYPLFGGIALSTGMARLYFDQHWFSDVTMGAVIGTLSGYAVIKAEKNNREINKSSGQLFLYPAYNGFCLAYKF